MTMIVTAPSEINPATFNLDAFTLDRILPVAECEARDRMGNRCYKRNPADMAEWCDICLDGHSPGGPLPGWMGGLVETGPTTLDHYEPTAEDLADYSALLADEDAREDLMHEWAEADRAESMEAAFSDPFDLVNPCELIECGGYHPSNAYAMS